MPKFMEGCNIERRTHVRTAMESANGYEGERMDDANLADVLESDTGEEFITFCLERIDRDQSVQTIWHDWLGRADQSERADQ